MKCECGCGQEVKEGNRFIHNHHCVGKISSFKGHKHTDTAKKKISNSSKGNQHWLGRKHTDKTKKKLSEVSSGENHPNWQGGVSVNLYCYKFNEEYKEKVRNKFSRLCFLCGKNEEENSKRKLSVHHIDYKKDCGCDGTICKCVPLCSSCHGKVHGKNKKYYERKMLRKLENI